MKGRRLSTKQLALYGVRSRARGRLRGLETMHAQGPLIGDEAPLTRGRNHSESMRTSVGQTIACSQIGASGQNVSTSSIREPTIWPTMKIVT